MKTTTALLITVALAVIGCDTPNNRTSEETYYTTTSQTPSLPGTLAPGDQSGSASDMEINQRIRQKIALDTEISTRALNIQVITMGGRVTLRGAVGSELEKNRIETIAQKESGAPIDSQLEIKANP